VERAFFSSIITKLNGGMSLKRLRASCAESSKTPGNDTIVTSINNALQSSSDATVEYGSAPVFGPMLQVKSLSFNSNAESEVWLKKARVDAIIGASPSSRSGVVTAVRCYLAFCVNARIDELALPPKADILLAWSTQFRNHLTFRNYIALLRTACQILDVSTAGFDPGLLRKATVAIEKRLLWKPREKFFITAEMLQRLLPLLSERYSFNMSMLFLVSYIFLLRLPSEAVHMVKVSPQDVAARCQSQICVDASSLRLTLARRKNMLRGSTMFRTCWCGSNAHKTSLCPIHVFGMWLQSLPAGTSLFAGISPKSALAALRDCLHIMGVSNFALYRTHDLRRGHAQDMVNWGARLCEILAAGQWRSPSFMAYIDVASLECAAAVEAHQDDSSGDEDEQLTSDRTEAVVVDDPEVQRQALDHKLSNMKNIVSSIVSAPLRSDVYQID